MSFCMKCGDTKSHCECHVQPGVTSDVRQCQLCGCKTWHTNGVCEWADGHKPKPFNPVAQEQLRRFGGSRLD